MAQKRKTLDTREDFETFLDNLIVGTGMVPATETEQKQARHNALTWCQENGYLDNESMSAGS